MNKGLTLRTGQTHVARWTRELLGRIEQTARSRAAHDSSPDRAG